MQGCDFTMPESKGFHAQLTPNPLPGLGRIEMVIESRVLCSVMRFLTHPSKSCSMFETGSYICLVDDGPARLSISLTEVSDRLLIVQLRWRDLLEHDCTSSEHHVALPPRFEVRGPVELNDDSPSEVNLTPFILIFFCSRCWKGPHTAISV